MDLALNDRKRLICHKTQPTNRNIRLGWVRDWVEDYWVYTHAEVKVQSFCRIFLLFFFVVLLSWDWYGTKVSNPLSFFLLLYFWESDIISDFSLPLNPGQSSTRSEPTMTWRLIDIFGPSSLRSPLISAGYIIFRTPAQIIAVILPVYALHADTTIF